jgi:TonB family protein
MAQALFYNEYTLPWSKTENDFRFNKVLKRSLLFFLLLAFIIPFLPTPEVEKKELKQIAPRLAKLIIQKKKQVKVAKKPAAKKSASKKKAQKKKAKAKKTKKKSKKPAAKKKARKKAASSGLMALTDDLADLRDSFNVSSVKSTNLSKNGKTKSKRAASNILTAKAGSGSGGINTGSLSNQTGGGSLSGRSVAGVSSNIGGGTGTRRTAGGKAGRSQEEIERVFQRNKGSIFAIYNRALRKDPSLQGKVVLELTILPSGKVTKCRIISSELKAKKFERKLTIKVKSFRFLKKDVATVKITYPIDFLPS